ncbi:MAG: sigma-70 family RNA polymerase sigma factor [Acidobacteriota bacterium]
MERRSPALFPETPWTLILSSRDRTTARRTALHELLVSYWKPLYFYVRRKGHSVESAEDVIQGLCVQLLEKDFLARLDPGRGRFRSYLRTAVDHYLVNMHEKDAAQKRGGGARLVPLDVELAETQIAAAPESAEDAYDREWAAAVLARALTRLRRDFDAGGRKGSFDVAVRFFGFTEAPSYADAARDAGMSVVQLKAFLHRTRERFRALVREEVARTVPDPEDVDTEIAQLTHVLRR